ncbi:MAG TPA: hypothetical protein VJR47_14530 [Stellaceae bacterium]|nr:hypothetical protein [Stellaceae bacterium]
MEDRSRAACRLCQEAALGRRHIGDEDELRPAQSGGSRPSADQPFACGVGKLRAWRGREHSQPNGAGLIKPGEAAQRRSAIADQGNAQP